MSDTERHKIMSAFIGDVPTYDVYNRTVDEVHIVLLHSLKVYKSLSSL